MTSSSAARRVTDDVQHRTEHFALQAADAVELDQRRARRKSRAESPAGSATRCSTRPGAAIAATCASSSVARLRVDDRVPHRLPTSAGSPMRELVHRARSNSITRGAISSCTKSTRSAEQRCPALLKAEVTASTTTCSGSAELSTIIAFWPPVSAISGDLRVAPCERAAISLATAVDPVKATPAMRGSSTSAAPTVSPAPGSSA